MAKLGSTSAVRGLVIAFAAIVLMSWASLAHALTTPIAGAVPYPASGPKLYLPFPAGSKIRVLSGYSPSGGSSLHADTNATSKANDYYALDLVYDDQPNAGKGLPVVAPLAGKVVRAGWATSGWANYGQRVILEHDLGDGHVYHSLYAHMDSLAVTEGAQVTVGQKLGALGQSCQGTLSCSSFSTPHLHWALHRDSLVGGSGTGGSYGGNAVVPESMDGVEDLKQGTLITSTNTSNPVCGDSVCNGTETQATCPGDCKVCELIPSQGRIVDETEDLCFKQSGSPAYWYSASVGYQSSLFWTNATNDPNPDNFGVWELNFAEAGDYDVEAYTASFAQSKQAAYTIKHGGQSSKKTLDQSAKDGWQSLGVFAFTKGAAQSLRLDDNSGEAVSLKRKLVFDAIRLTRINGGTGGTGGSGTAGSAGSAGAVAGGSGGASSSGGQSNAGGAPAAGGGSTSEDEAGGCACRLGSAEPPGLRFCALGWLLALSLARRRRSLSRHPRL